MKKIKILIEMKHGLGDCVCMLPAIRAVRGKFPDAYIALLINGKANEEIFRHSGIPIDKYYYFSLKKRSKLYTLKTLFTLMKERFNIGIMATMTPATKGKYLFKLLGISQCFGEQYEGIHFLDLDNKKHFVDRNLDVISSLTGVVTDKQPHLYVRTEERKIEKKLALADGKNIVVNIGGADKNYYKGNYVYTRNWNQKNMVKLVSMLAQLKEYNILLLGGKLEEELLPNYREILKANNVYNFVNRTSISESIYILSKCICSIGVDTGMQHVADALGKSTISIFGPTNPVTHGAYSDKAIFVQCQSKMPCQYCFDTAVYYECPERKCLNSISAEQVFCKVEELINK
jgi:ADP-heptose:LPS heptosyltransferase